MAVRYQPNRCAAPLDAPYPEDLRAILSLAALADARAAISAWSGYAPTPLRDLSGLAREAGLGAIRYKDEAGRFGLGSFKALGGGVCGAAARAAERRWRWAPDGDVRHGR